MPDAQGRIRSILVPRVPWHEDQEGKDRPVRRSPVRRRVVVRGGKAVEVNVPSRETR